MQRPIDTHIDAQRCSGCGACARICPTEALTLVDGVARVTGTLSLGCGQCAAVCPEDAVRVGFVDGGATQLATITGAEGYTPPGAYDTAGLVRLMRSRRSCRAFGPRPVERQVLEDLVRIGTLAPSGTNDQRWTFTVLPQQAAVRDLGAAVARFFTRLNRLASARSVRWAARLVGRPELQQYYKEHYATVAEGLRQWNEEGRDRLFHGAPAAILVGAQGRGSCPSEDALLASGNILLAAHAMGLGTCLIGFVVEAMRHDPSIKDALGIPRGERVYAAIALGWPKVTYHREAGRRRVEPRFVEQVPPGGEGSD